MERKSKKAGFKMKSGNMTAFKMMGATKLNRTMDKSSMPVGRAKSSAFQKIVEGRDQKDSKGMYKTLINKSSGEIRKDYDDGSFVITTKGKGDVQPRTREKFSDWTRVASEKKPKVRSKKDEDLKKFSDLEKFDDDRG